MPLTMASKIPDQDRIELGVEDAPDGVVSVALAGHSGTRGRLVVDPGRDHVELDAAALQPVEVADLRRALTENQVAGGSLDRFPSADAGRSGGRRPWSGFGRPGRHRGRSALGEGGEDQFVGDLRDGSIPSGQITQFAVVFFSRFELRQREQQSATAFVLLGEPAWSRPRTSTPWIRPSSATSCVLKMSWAPSGLVSGLRNRPIMRRQIGVQARIEFVDEEQGALTQSCEKRPAQRDQGLGSHGLVANVECRSPMLSLMLEQHTAFTAGEACVFHAHQALPALELLLGLLDDLGLLNAGVGCAQQPGQPGQVTVIGAAEA